MWAPLPDGRGAFWGWGFSDEAAVARVRVGPPVSDPLAGGGEDTRGLNSGENCLAGEGRAKWNRISGEGRFTGGAQ